MNKIPSRNLNIPKIINKNKYTNCLEIGCDNDENFSKIIINKKIGVDPLKGGTHRMTSDEFFKKNHSYFDIIFLDPPYDFVVNEYLKIINEIFSKNLLNIEGSLIIEHSEKINISEHPNFEKSRNYGGCSFSFFYI